PEVDGIAATQAIRQHEKDDHLPPAPILGLTGHTMTSIRLLCMQAGMNDLIVKPFLPGALYDKLDALLSTR
ncbi:MAG: response regulator, partial [Asticcacaulis sp.]|nr:response regulator [Asticcacaulis sp.]